VADRPWWQTTKTARVGFMVGLLWIPFGVSQLLLALGTSHHRGLGFVAGLVGAVVFLPLGAIYLVTAALLRRRELTGTPGQPGLPPSS
jgi:hypothetical protein